MNSFCCLLVCLVVITQHVTSYPPLPSPESSPISNWSFSDTGFRQGSSFNVAVANAGRSFQLNPAYLYAFFIMNIFASVCALLHFHICTEQQTAQIVHALGYGI